ncbi:nascent polypeptide-associated complex subunit alpha, muscle-specific form-like [Amphibalanus amphitrite]|uniref:nascent polypeptide-associated complex subunit alpha, muscle-specific form-like n=1 Tax=Amphibalanus amphitrite TaxID=1232801 RepID=UPI001C920AD8|nr:nascent polypeptide-associated complex subunit alpha, muscle-specific form-like [Amphibalanus amphitrite]
MDPREGMPFGWPPESVRRRPPPPPAEYLAAQYHPPPPGLYPPHSLAGAPPPYAGLHEHELGGGPAPAHYPPPPDPFFQAPPPPPPPPAERLLYQEEPYYMPLHEPPPLPPPQHQQHYMLQPDELHGLRLQHGRLGALGGHDGPLQRHLSSPAGLLSAPPPLPPVSAPFHATTAPSALRFSPRLAAFGAEPEHEGDGEFGTARISDNLAAHLSQMEAPPPQLEPSPPPPAAAPSFLSTLFGGWRGDAATADSGLPVSFGVKPADTPPSPPSTPVADMVQELGVTVAAPATPEPAPASPTPTPVVVTRAEPARPSYSAVLAKPRPPPAPPAAAQRSVDSGSVAGRQQSGGPRGQTARAGESESGGGSRRGGRGGRRRRSSADTVTRAAARGSPAGGTPARQPTAPAGRPAQEQQPPPPPQVPGKPADTSKKKKRSGKSSRSESSDCSVAGRRAETLNNNPDRAQPTVQRRPLNYNNNLGASSTLGPAQTHVHAPPPPPTAGDTKKIDVNVGKQKNCAGKTSNESKKVAEETMDKPDNKTLSQSRGSQPLNLLTPGGAAKSERVSKELAFRARPGRASGRGRREAGEPTSDLLRRLAAQLTPGVALVGTLLAWLAHLVCDVTLMSSRLLGVLILSVVEAGRLRACRAAGRARAAVTSRLAAIRDWWSRPAASGTAGSGLTANISLPATGEDAMKRLLACKDKDPYSILGVTHNCSDADIKKYYKRQALLVHPDKSRSPGADEAFKILRRAFELIGLPEQRAAFDAQAKEQREVDLAFRQYTEELMTRLREKIEETQNTLRCNNCNQRHRRSRTQRPCYAARACATCKIQHAAREGDIWAESRWLGLFWRYYACMDGGVFDISEWAACQSQSLKHLQANHHTVQYRIISGAKRHRPPADEPSDRDLEDILSNLYNNGSMSGEPAAGQRRRGGRRRAH